MKVTIVQSLSDCRPDSSTLAEHSSAEVKSRLLPDEKPCLRHKASAAATQSGAPFDAAFGGVDRALADIGPLVADLLVVVGGIIDPPPGAAQMIAERVVPPVDP